MGQAKTVRFLLVTLATIAVLPPARAQLDDATRYRRAYNSNLITQGMSLYYKHHQRLPQSLSHLIETNWVPPNLVNPCTGEIITGDSPDSSPGGYLVEQIGTQGLRITCFREGRPTVIEYDLEDLGAGMERLTLEEARTNLWMSWAFRCLQAYHNTTGELPGSIDDLIDAGFWPFEGLANMVTGKPMAFSSDNPGDMHWVFKEELIGVRLTLPESPDGRKKPSVVLEYPTPEEGVVFVHTVGSE